MGIPSAETRALYNCIIHAMRRKDNQSERLNHLYETKYTKLFW